MNPIDPRGIASEIQSAADPPPPTLSSRRESSRAGKPLSPTVVRARHSSTGDGCDAVHTIDNDLESTEPPPSTPRLGDILARKYRIERVLGRGGMGIVYAATHLGLDMQVAIKVLNDAARRAGARLIQEALICARLASEHIPRIFDLDCLPSGAPFIVMEYLEGEDLAKVIARGPVAPLDSGRLMMQTCAGLREAHAEGIVHRDLKPANLFISKRGLNGVHLKVLDFGISQSIAESHPLAGPGSGTFLGTPLYMSPEQIRAQNGLDARTDIWSLGVIFYELLTGRAPFCGPTLSSLSVAIATEEPLSPSAIRAGVPKDLEVIVLRCLQKDRTRRFASVVEIMRAVRQWANVRERSAQQPSSTRAEPTADRATRARAAWQKSRSRLRQ